MFILSGAIKSFFDLVCLNVNVLNTNSRTRGHPFKLFKAHGAGVRASFYRAAWNASRSCDENSVHPSVRPSNA